MKILTVESLGSLFYAVSPWKTSYENIEDVPNYYVKAVPWMVLLVLLERLYLIKERKISTFNEFRVNDLVGSFSLGLMDQITKIALGSWRFIAYAYIYTNWRIVTLPWDSLWTWFIAFLAADFFYYFTHRLSHEVNFLWSGHQLHHSSEDFTLATALRQSVLVSQIVWFFYFFAAFVVPPAAMLVHYQLNFLYQFWIHTEVIKSLGPLEYIFNTASHHRVHHGRNRYCIDKNYAAVLIIWDRMFGTFEAEKGDIVYGLVHPVNTFEPVSNQFRHFLLLLKASWSIKGWRNKLSVLFKGPGWSPGKPRLGNLEDIPEIEYPIQKYDPCIPVWCQIYCLAHSLIVVLVYLLLDKIQSVTPTKIIIGAVSYCIFSLASIGIMFDKKPYAVLVESFRCLLYIVFDYYFIPWILPSNAWIAKSHILLTIRGIFLISGAIWIVPLVYSFKIERNFKNTKV